MDISAISGDYTNFLQTSQAAQSKINTISKVDTKEAKDEELMDACKQFEEYLVEMVVKEVAKTTNITGLGLDESATDAAMSTSNDLLKDKMVRSLSETISENANLGIAQKLYESMRRDTVSVEELAQNAAQQGAVTTTEE